MSNEITPEGIALVKSFEGCKLTPYLCPAGVLTVGYGHTGFDVQKNVPITQDQADALLAEDLDEAADSVENCVHVPINDNQFSALVSFVFNLGAGSLHGSTLLRKLNAGDNPGAANEFLKWNHVNGQVNDGLTRRRLAECELFLKPLEA